MPAYIIAWVAIGDRERYQKYLDVAPSVIRQYGGRVIARSECPVTLEGPAEKRKIIIIAFPSADRAREFYDSPEYRAARDLRRDCAEGEMIVVYGIVPEPGRPS